MFEKSPQKYKSLQCLNALVVSVYWMFLNILSSLSSLKSKGFKISLLFNSLSILSSLNILKYKIIH
jgi:hypothetical protein